MMTASGLLRRPLRPSSSVERPACHCSGRRGFSWPTAHRLSR